MARVTQSSSMPNTEEWREDHWYLFKLRGWEIEPAGTPGYKGQPRKHPRATLTWELPGTEDWVFDWVDCTVSLKQDKTASKGLLLICALSGRDWRREPSPWLDNETLEYGFGPDPATDTPAGRIVTGVQVAAKGDVVKDSNGYSRLRIERYGPAAQAGPNAAMAAQQRPADTPPAAHAQLSPDGRWRWDGSAWVPNTAPPAPPPAPAPAAPQQQELI